MNGDLTPTDVFLSYSRADQDAVESIASALRERGLKPFLDRWYLPGGQPWPEALERELARCRAVAVFLGPAGMGSWQKREAYKALDRQTHEDRFPVIPVLLPGLEDPALGFLGLNTWVDLRRGIGDPAKLSDLAAAVRGQAVGPGEAPRAGDV